jgi:hypothetical protein
LGTLKFLYSRVLNAKPDRKNILGTHVLQKTAYLFAAWGSRMSDYYTKKAALFLEVPAIHNHQEMLAQHILLIVKHCGTWYKQTKMVKRTTESQSGSTF